MLAKTASAGATPLSRYVRWRVASTVAASFDVTFRIRVVPNRRTYFAPTQLPGCVLWLRADIGLGFNGTSVSAWLDQSGRRNNAAQPSQSNQPAFAQTAMNGWPAVQGNGSSNWDIPTSTFSLGANATLFAACHPTATTQNGTARLFEHKYNQTYYLGCTTSGTAYKLIVNNGSAPYGTAEGGTISLANTLVTGAYSSATGVGTLYVNGTSVATSSFTAPSTTSYPLHVLHAADSYVTYWNGYLGEVVVYERALTSTELTRVHRYLGARYGVVVP